MQYEPVNSRPLACGSVTWTLTQQHFPELASLLLKDPFPNQVVPHFKRVLSLVSELLVGDPSQQTHTSGVMLSLLVPGMIFDPVPEDKQVHPISPNEMCILPR